MNNKFIGNNSIKKSLNNYNMYDINDLNNNIMDNFNMNNNNIKSKNMNNNSSSTFSIFEDINMFYVKNSKYE